MTGRNRQFWLVAGCLLLIGATLAIFVFGSRVHAAGLIASQPDQSTIYGTPLSSSPSIYSAYVNLTALESANIGAAEFYFGGQGSPAVSYIDFQVSDYTNGHICVVGNVTPSGLGNPVVSQAMTFYSWSGNSGTSGTGLGTWTTQYTGCDGMPIAAGDSLNIQIISETPGQNVRMQTYAPAGTTDGGGPYPYLQSAYVGLADSSGFPIPTTSISITEPVEATTTASTTFTIGADYSIGPNLGIFSLIGAIPNQVGLNLILQNNATGVQTNLGTDYSISQGEGSYTYSTTTTAAQGDYSLWGTLVGDYGTTTVAAGCTPLPPFVTCTSTENTANLVTSLPSIEFSVDNGILPLVGFNNTTLYPSSALATTTCDVTHLGGCVQNAVAFLFYPNPADLATFSFLWYNVQQKPPFGYVTQTVDALGGWNASSTAAYTAPTIPAEVLVLIFDPLDTGIAWLLWIGWGVAMIWTLHKLDL